MTILSGLFYFFAAVSIYLGVLSLRGGIRFTRYLRTPRSVLDSEFTPFVSVFLPLRGVDDGLSDNIKPLLDQDYPKYEVIFVSDAADDPAWQIVEQTSLPAGVAQTKKIVAGLAMDRGQKVHNLSVAIEHADPAAEVFAFVDSDARVSRNWLRALVAPLQDVHTGGATGYRWFVPVRGGFASQLRSVWNAAIASALGADEKRNFCWGGSTALRRATFNACGVLEHWRGTVSDDFAITRALKSAALPIKFVPECLTPSFEDCSASELVEFTTRQVKITRAYAAHLWKAILFGSAIFVLTFFGGLAWVMVRAFMRLPITLPLVLLLIIFAMGAIKSYLRLRAVAGVIDDPRVRTLSSYLAHATLWPLASALYLYNALAAAFSRRISWRGIVYQLKSADEGVMIKHQRSEVRD